MSEKERCKHGLVREWCGECNKVEEEMSEANGKHRRMKRGERKRLKELEKRASEEADRILAGHHPDRFTRELMKDGKWYAEVEELAKVQPITREDRRHALLKSLGPAIRSKAAKFSGTDSRKWGAHGFEWDERVNEFVIMALEVIDEFLDQEESGSLPEGLQGVEPAKAVGSMFEFASRKWYYPKKVDHVVLGGRGLGGEEKYLAKEAARGGPEEQKALKKFRRELRKINRERKRWLIPFDTRWRDAVVPKDILIRAQFENLTVEGAAWQGYITWEQADMLIKRASFRTPKELAEELGISKSTLYKRLKPAMEAWMPYAKAAIRFGWRRFLKKGMEFDPRKWRQDEAGETEPGGPEPESEDDLDALWYGAADDDFQSANED